MLKAPHCLYWLAIIIFFICGCGSDNSRETAGKDFSVVAFSDIHFDPFYDPSLFPELVAAEAGQWESIFKSSTLTTPSPIGSGTNYPLLMLTLSSIQKNMESSPLVIYTGDILVHRFSQTFFTLYGSQDTEALKVFADKTISFFTKQVRLVAGTVPIMFAIGNNDSYSDSGPDSTFFSNTAEFFYQDFLNGTEDHQDFLMTFNKGGYYSAEPSGTDVMILSLNTVPFAAYPPGADTENAAAAQLNWLDAKLASAEASGKNVWLIMHAPPGADIYWATRLADSNGHVDATGDLMMWKSDDQTLFLNILAKYPGSIALSLAGHTHMDEYRILPSGDVIKIIPSIGTRSGNNPAFKVFTIALETSQAKDYHSYNYDLATLPDEFIPYYTFSTTNSMYGFLNDSLWHLFPALAADDNLQEHYRGHYYSGNNTSNPINETNWPIYWCGIGKMEQPEFVDCVNSY